MTLPDRRLNRKLMIDWGTGTDADTTPYNDVTYDVIRGSITTSHGRDQARATAPPKGETLSVVLNNQDGKYNNVAGPLASFVNRGPEVDFYVEHQSEVTLDDLDITLEDEDWTLDDPNPWHMFTGVVDNAPQQIALIRSVAISAIGSMRFFTRKKITVPLQENTTIDVILHLICNAVGFPSGTFRVFDSGNTVIERFWMNEQVALPVMLQLLAAEGADSALFFDQTGTLIFQGRNYRDDNYRSVTVQYYLHDKLQASVPYREPIYYNPGTVLNQDAHEVYNKVSARAMIRELEGISIQVWHYGALLTLSASETRTIYAEISESPVRNAIVPTVTTDFTILSGGVASITMDTTQGQRIGITITATGAGNLQIQGPSGQESDGIFLRAQRYNLLSEIPIVSDEDVADSITRYGEQELSVPIWAEMNPNSIRDLVNGIVNRYKEPREQLTLSVENIDSAHAVFIMNCTISDRVHVTNTAQGIDHDYFIETKEIKTVGNGGVACTLGLEKAYDIEAFRFGIDNFGENVFGE